MINPKSINSALLTTSSYPVIKLTPNDPEKIYIDNFGLLADFLDKNGACQDVYRIIMKNLKDRILAGKTDLSYKDWKYFKEAVIPNYVKLINNDAVSNSKQTSKCFVPNMEKIFEKYETARKLSSSNSIEYNKLLTELSDDFYNAITVSYENNKTIALQSGFINSNQLIDSSKIL